MWNSSPYEVAALAVQLMIAHSTRPGMTFDDTSGNAEDFLGEAVALILAAAEKMPRLGEQK